MSKWIINTNFGYVESSIGRHPLRATFTENIDNARYDSFDGIRNWAADLLINTDCGITFIELIPLTGFDTQIIVNIDRPV